MSDQIRNYNKIEAVITYPNVLWFCILVLIKAQLIKQDNDKVIREAEIHNGILPLVEYFLRKVTASPKTSWVGETTGLSILCLWFRAS